MGMFYVTISGNFERFQYFNLETDFPENENLLQKPGVFWKCIQNTIHLYIEIKDKC